MSPIQKLILAGAHLVPLYKAKTTSNGRKAGRHYPRYAGFYQTKWDGSGEWEAVGVLPATLGYFVYDADLPDKGEGMAPDEIMRATEARFAFADQVFGIPRLVKPSQSGKAFHFWYRATDINTLPECALINNMGEVLTTKMVTAVGAEYLEAIAADITSEACEAYFERLRPVISQTSTGTGDGRNGKLFNRVFAVIANEANPEAGLRAAVAQARADGLDDAEIEATGNSASERAEVLRAKQVKPEQEVAGQCESHADIARLFVKLHGENHCWTPGINRWHTWEGVWAHDDTGRTRKLVSHVAENTYGHWKKKGDARVFVVNRDKGGSRPTAEAALSLSQPDIAVPINDWDAQPNLFGLRDGMVLDLDTGSTRAQERKDYITKQGGVAPTGEISPRLAEWLEAKIPIKEERDFVQKFCGYTLSGSAHEQLALWLWGPTSTGKSTLLELLLATHGQYGYTIPGDLFLETNIDQSNPRGYKMAKTVSARLITVSEWKKQGAMDEAWIRSLTGGDTISARDLRQPWFEYRPRFKFIFATNTLPKMEPATARRIAIIQMGEGHKDTIDPTLADTLVREEAGAFAEWCRQGYLRWKREGLRPVPKLSEGIPVEKSTLTRYIEKALADGALKRDNTGHKMGAQTLADILEKHKPANAIPLSRRDIYAAMKSELTGRRHGNRQFYLGFAVA